MRTQLVAVATLMAGASTWAQAYDRDLEQKVAADASGAVEISNVAGSLDITGWDRAEVEVRGTVGDGVDKVEVSGGGSRTYVKVITRRNTSDGEAHLQINVPKGSEVTATAVSADIASKRVTGRQRLTTVSGGIQAEIAGADSQVKSVSGDIHLQGSRQPADVRLSTVSGDLRLERAAGDVDATSVSGTVSVEVNPAKSVRLHSTAGDLTFTGQLAQNGSLDAETVSGEVKLAAGGGYEYEALTFSGEIENCFGRQAERTSPYGPGSRLNGKLGEGGGRVRVKAMSGDINLCDK